MNKTQHYVFVKTSFIGFHRWANAPEHLGYLKYPHRHVFNVKVNVAVNHDDRDIEFHEFTQELKGIVGLIAQRMQRWDAPENCSTLSCEQIGQAVVDLLPLRRITTVTVDEDGECGATTVVE